MRDLFVIKKKPADVGAGSVGTKPISEEMAQAR